MADGVNNVLLENVLRGCAGINDVDIDGNTAIHLAISTDANTNILQNLISKGADLYKKNNNEKTPFECLKHGSLETAISLLKLEKKNDFRDSDGSTLLHQLMDRIGDNLWGIQRPDDLDVGYIGHSEQDKLIGVFWDAILKEKESFNIDLNMQDNFGNTPLHIAADFWPSSKHLEVMLTHFDNFDPFKRDSKGNNFLHVYFRRHSIRDGTELDVRLLNAELPYLPSQTLRELLRCKNDILNSPLHVFMKECDNNINNHNLNRFIAAGSDVNLRDAAGDTALHCALKSYIDSEYEILDEAEIEMSKDELEEKVETIKFLVKNGSDISARNKKGDSALFLSYHYETVSTLLRLGADVNLKNNLEQTPLLSYMCRLSTDLKVIKSFLDAGADPCAVDIHGSTVLHYIAWHGMYTTIPYCLKIEKLKSSIDKLGQLPYDIAYSRGNGALFHELRANQFVLQVEHFGFQKRIIEFSDLLDGNSDKSENIFSHFKRFFRNDIGKLLYLPSFGLVSFESEAYLLKTAVCDMVMRICKKIENRHPLFSITLLQSGSVGENTKVCDPDEFDFLCIFGKLGDICCVDEQKSRRNPGYVYLKLRDEFCLSEYEEFFNSDRYLDTSKVRSMILDVLDNMSTLHDLFCHPFISFAADKSRGAESPTFQFSIRWSGCMYKTLKIDIDLVPACQINNFWPSNARLDLLQCDASEIKKEGAILMLQTALDEHFTPYSKQRVSALKAERAHFQSLPRPAFDAYVICKILCNNRICPVLKTVRNIEAKEVLTSYMLKNCLFHVVENQSKLSEKTCNKDTDELFQLVLDIFRKMLHFSVSEFLPSFVFPDQNVFTFNRMEEIINLKVDCSLRCVFLKMILRILGDIQNFNDIDISLWYEGNKTEYTLEDEIDYLSD